MLLKSFTSIYLAASFVLFHAVPLYAESDSLQPCVLIYGDSISAGYGIDPNVSWVAILDGKLRSTFEDWYIHNASVNGETTSIGLQRLQYELNQYRPSVVFIELGGNDGLRGYPIEKIAENLENMVKTSMEFGARVIVAGMRMPPNYGPQYTEEFHALYERVSSSTGAAYIPFLLEGIADQRELMQSDGIHPSVDAQTLIVDIAWPALKSAIEDILISQRRHPRGGSLDDQPDPPA